MATGEITTFPAATEDGGSSSFPPGNFKDPKRLYCKNGGFFLRIKSDGGVDGIREKSDPHSKYFQKSSPCFSEFTKASLCFFFFLNLQQGSRSETKNIMEGRSEFSILLKFILPF